MNKSSPLLALVDLLQQRLLRSWKINLVYELLPSGFVMKSEGGR